MMKKIDADYMRGVVLRPVEFEPTSNKWAGRACKGFQVHVTDPETYSPYALSLSLYQVIFQTYAEQFAYKQPPYEYEYEHLPIDLIIGDRQIRSQIEAGTPLTAIISTWDTPLSEYKEIIKHVAVYR
jgi:uncharacterized protein YbbC (DUF1343 family)